ncbi:MAG: M23 family metallopeptidase [Corynebacterium sp.]|nr:MAG: M23 family metallopeptidase [Corynebacterium sp.]
MVSTPPPAAADPSQPQITRPTHPASPRTGHPTGFTNPVTRLPRPNRVLRPFNKPAKNWLPGHRGVDLEAAPTDPIYAAGDGTVIYAGTLAGIPTVSIEHPGGLRTTYQPVLPLVAVGDTVTGQQPIGTLAPGGTHGYPGLQWGAKFGADDYINPLTLLPAPVIRLKPPPSA